MSVTEPLLSGIDPPRDPQDIRPTAHFLSRFSPTHGPVSATRRDPPITAGVIRACVTEGAIERAREGRIRYETWVEGYDWRLVVGFDPDPVAITAYVPGLHGRETYGGDSP